MLNCEKIKKTFDAGAATEKIALNGCSLRLEANDFVTVIGGNGAGKSTILNAIAGVFMTEEGRISIDNVDVTRIPEHARAAHIGRVFQDPRMSTSPSMNIEENLAIAYRRGKRRTLRWGISRRERDIFRTHLETLGLGLENRLTVKVGTLSGGQRQALTLLMATIQKPKVLLLDEHTAALDPKTAKIVLELTNRVVEENKLTTLMVTHNMRDALKTGNRIMMMHEGQIILDVGGEEKKGLTVPDLLKMFEQASGEEMMSDRMLLS
ncbi:MAG: ABC transporter ATP-binding protein [Defluviitaleaceae bacterium]|nr:ABC transporter ATP-binding protein [Defluviitaleaceae bacterium]